MARRKRKRKERPSLRVPLTFEQKAMTTLAYLESGLVPPIDDRPWHPPHVRTGPGEDVPPCDFPRSARRKFRKEWRRVAAALERSGRPTKKYRQVREDGSPSQSARLVRRYAVMDSMLRRGEAILEDCEQQLAREVESGTDAESAS